MTDGERGSEVYIQDRRFEHEATSQTSRFGKKLLNHRTQSPTLFTTYLA